MGNELHNWLDRHIGPFRNFQVQAGYNTKCLWVLLLHGFPELAHSWRKVMPVLASANNYVVAFDQRGYERNEKVKGLKIMLSFYLINDRTVRTSQITIRQICSG